MRGESFGKPVMPSEGKNRIYNPAYHTETLTYPEVFTWSRRENFMPTQAESDHSANLFLPEDIQRFLPDRKSLTSFLDTRGFSRVRRLKDFF